MHAEDLMERRPVGTGCRLGTGAETAGLSQAALAMQLRCQQSLIARIESGERRIDVVELIVLARALGTDPGAILAHVAQAVPLDAGL